MHISRLILNPRSRQVRRDLASAYEMHRSLMRAFPDAAEGGPGRVLFRLEPSQPGRPPIVIVQSEKQPEWSALETIDGYLLSVDSKPFEPSIQSGQCLRFRLRANPTVSKKFEGSSRGKRIGLVHPADQLRWLQRKAQQAGFEVLGLDEQLDRMSDNGSAAGAPPGGVAVVRPEKTITSAGTSRKPGRQTHMSVDFEGMLRVTDPELFLQTLANGIGPAKGYGFGLLSVARV